LFQYVIELAIKLLNDLHYSIENVANAVCYKNHLNFYRKFKKYTGILPNEYKNKNYDHIVI